MQLPATYLPLVHSRARSASRSAHARVVASRSAGDIAQPRRAPLTTRTARPSVPVRISRRPRRPSQAGARTGATRARRRAWRRRPRSGASSRATAPFASPSWARQTPWPSQRPIAALAAAPVITVAP